MFTLVPVVIRTTSLMRPETDESAVMIGSGADADRVAYFSDELSKWIMVDVGSAYPYDCQISFEGDTLLPNIVPVHGYPAWVGDTYCIFWDPIATQWVGRAQGMLGHIYTPADDEAWWSYSGATPYSATYTKRCTATADATAAITAWPRWESSTQFGEYSPQGGATGTRIIGLPYWHDGEATEYIRSLEASGANSTYLYGDVYYSAIAEAWVIGTPGDAAGWWVGLEPSTSGTTTFVHTGEEPDIVLTFQGYAAGANAGESIYIGEAAIWRI
jgi:hypothetical protein